MRIKYFILLLIVMLFGLIVAAIVYYIKSPITVKNFDNLDDINYRIICYSEWENKVLHIPIYIKSFKIKDSSLIFNVLNYRKINNESLRLCPSIYKLDSILTFYKEFEIEIYKNNVTNVDEVPADYYYRITKNNLDKCDSLYFSNNCFKLERIK